MVPAGRRVMLVASTASFQPGSTDGGLRRYEAYVRGLGEATRLRASRHRGHCDNIVPPAPNRADFFKVAGPTNRAAPMMSAAAVARTQVIAPEGRRRVLTPAFFNNILAIGARLAPHSITCRPPAPLIRVV